MDKQQNDNDRARAYWRANLRLIIVLLTIWALVSLGAAILFAPFLSGFNVGQLPMSFWFAQQGAMITFVILIFVYAWRMNKIDRQFGMEEREEEEQS
jgi:putative solute:sodium symporter small subunit